MKDISITTEFSSRIHTYKGAVISCKVVNGDSLVSLWEKIDLELNEFRQKYQLEDINRIVAIDATRKAYRLLGKDPNRYRPSAAALCRRICMGKPLYKIDTLVDLINWASIRTGFSIGGFDEDKIVGDSLKLDVGHKEDVFNAIGRGLLNIEGLPVFRDAIGGIGTPTSDEERTKITVTTTNLLMIINSYDKSERLKDDVNWIIEILIKYVQAEQIHVSYIE